MRVPVWSANHLRDKHDGYCKTKTWLQWVAWLFLVPTWATICQYFAVNCESMILLLF